jgi:aminoglycoside phosphotransferase (APT) family kinase protein
MEITLNEIAEGFARWASAKHYAGASVRVSDVEIVPGGASRETYIVTYQVDNKEARRVVLRRDPVGSLIDTERRVEYGAYAAFAGSDVPVPAPMGLEYDEQWLKRPFSVMEMVEGCYTDPKMFERAPHRDMRGEIGKQKWEILGRIAAANPTKLGLTKLLEAPAPDEAWSHELDYWAKVIDTDEVSPQPIARKAIRALRNRPPPPAAKISVVHGDYRSGNFLFDDAGVVRAILDWEMCHLGDPLEDIAWAFNPIYCGGDVSRIGRLVSREESIRHWQNASGLKVDPVALKWWELFTGVKALAIYISAIKVFASKENTALIMILPAWFGMDQVSRSVLDQLETW